MRKVSTIFQPAHSVLAHKVSKTTMLRSQADDESATFFLLYYYYYYYNIFIVSCDVRYDDAFFCTSIYSATLLPEFQLDIEKKKLSWYFIFENMFKKFRFFTNFEEN